MAKSESSARKIFDSLNTNKSSKESASDAPSKKGFVAIDMDGTALVQKIDKYGLHGITNAQANIRESLMAYIAAAQEQGFDIYILTARPSMVEALLDMPIGTQSTYTIREQYETEGIHIKDIKRAQKKGPAMNELLAEYPEGAHGFLIDDQLKQIASVEAHRTSENVHGIDINSHEDLQQYLQITGAKLESVREIFQPERIIDSILNPNNEREATATVSALRELQQSIDSSACLTAAEQDYYDKVIKNLCLKAFETEFVGYKPDLDWITNTAQMLQQLVKRHAAMSLNDLSQVSKQLFHASTVNGIQPNSRCDQSLQQLLSEVSMRAAVNDLKIICENYANYLQSKPLEDAGIIASKLASVQGLSTLLHNDADPEVVLEAFMDGLDGCKELFNLSQDVGFLESVREVLTQLPLIGNLFKNKGERLVDALGEITKPFQKDAPDALQDKPGFGLK